MSFLTHLRTLAALGAVLLTLPALVCGQDLTTGPVKPARATTSRTLALAAEPARPAEEPTAPQLVSLTGVVLKANGKPCAGAAVYLPGQVRQLVVTDANGAFQLPVPATQDVSLQVEFFGLGSTRVKVGKPTAQPLRITLGN